MPDSLPSIADLLKPETLAPFMGERPATVTVRPFSSVDGYSGGQLELVEAHGAPRMTFVLKHIRIADDWLMQITHDTRARAVVAWETGLLGLLPNEFEHGVLACAREGDEAAILMRDLGQALFPSGDDPISAADNARLLGAMARLHAAFWERSELAAPAAGFMELRDRVALLTPPTVRQLLGRGYGIPEMATEGWELLLRRSPARLVSAVGPLLEHVAPVVAAMLGTPQTVTHGDWKIGNLGLTRERSPRVAIIDWAMVGPGPGAFDLAWYLAVNSARLPVVREECIETYRVALASALGPRYGDSWWRPQLALSLLGGFLMLGWQKALGAFGAGDPATVAREQREVEWWSARALEGVRLL